MDVELLRDGAPECPLLRLHSSDPREFAHLRDLIDRLSTGAEAALALNSEPYVLVGIDSLTLGNAGDRGLREEQSGRLVWNLTPYDWESVSLLLQPLSDPTEADGFQWLDEAGRGRSEGIAVLATRTEDGTW